MFCNNRGIFLCFAITGALFSHSFFGNQQLYCWLNEFIIVSILSKCFFSDKYWSLHTTFLLQCSSAACEIWKWWKQIQLLNWTFLLPKAGAVWKYCPETKGWRTVCSWRSEFTYCLWWKEWHSIFSTAMNYESLLDKTGFTDYLPVGYQVWCSKDICLALIWGFIWCCITEQGFNHYGLIGSSADKL